MKIPEYGHRVPIQTTRAPIRKQFVPRPPKPTKALIQFGQAAVSTAIGLVQQRREQQEADELIEAQLGTLEEVQSLMLEYESDTDFETQVERFQSEKEKIRRKWYSKITLENPKSGYDQWYKKSSLDWDFKIEMQSVNLERNYSKAKTLEELDRATKLPDGKKLVTTILSAKAKLFPKEIIEAMETACYHKIDVYQTAAMAQEIFNKSGIDAARQYIYGDKVPESITKEDKDSLFEDIKDYQAEIDTQRKKEYEEQQKALDNAALEKLMAGTLQKEDFRAGGEFENLKRERKEHYWNIKDGDAKAAEKASEADRKDQEIQTSDEVLAKIMEMYDNPEIEDQEIMDYLVEHGGVDLTWTNYWTWRGRVLKRTPDLIKKYAIDTIGDAFNDRIEGETNFKKKSALVKEKVLMLKQYDEWYEKNKDVTEDEKTDKIIELLKPFKRKWTSKLIDKLEEQRGAIEPKEELKEYEVIIIDKKDGSEWIYNRKTGKKRRVKNR